MRLRHGVPLAVVALALAACSSGSATSAPPTTRATTAVVDPAAATAAASSPAARANRVGDTVTTDGVTVRLLAFRPAVKLDVSPDGPANHWAAAKVRTCYRTPIAGAPGYIAVSWHPWSLVDAGGGRWPAFEEGTLPDAWKSPVYPQDDSQQVALGECAVGWIEFPVDDGVKVKQLRYTTDGAPAVAWSL